MDKVRPSLQPAVPRSQVPETSPVDPPAPGREPDLLSSPPPGPTAELSVPDNPPVLAPPRREPAAAVWGPERAQAATRDMAVLHGNRAFEVAVGRCLELPGTAALDGLDMHALRDSVRVALVQTPAQGRQAQPMDRAEAARLATQQRLRVLTGGSDELQRKLNVVMRAVLDARKGLARELPKLLGADHPLHETLASMPEARRAGLLTPLMEGGLRSVQADLPLAAREHADVLHIFAGGAFRAHCAAQLRPFVEQLSPSALGTGLATLYAQHGERFVRRYNQGRDPHIVHPGNDGLCLGLCLQWLHDHGVLHLDADGSVGPQTARRVRNMQRSMELSRRIVDVPGFRERTAAIMKAATAAGSKSAGEPRREVAGRPPADPAAAAANPPLREQLSRAQWQQEVRAQTARREALQALSRAARRQPALPMNSPEVKELLARHRAIDFLLPYRMIHQGVSRQAGPRPILLTLDPVTPLEPKAWCAGLHQALNSRLLRAEQKLRATGRATQWVLDLQLGGAAHAVALSIGPHSPTDLTPRLVFFDPNAGEAVFSPRDPGQAVTSLRDFAHFETFSESWFQQMHDGRGISVRVRNAAE